MPFTILRVPPQKQRGDAGKAPAVGSGFVIEDSEVLVEGKALVRTPGSIDGLGANCCGRSWSGPRIFLGPPERERSLAGVEPSRTRGRLYHRRSVGSRNRETAGVVADGFTVQRIIRTGFLPAVGHQIEFDDKAQTITITTSTLQVIKMAPESIQIRSDAKTSINMTNESVQIVAGDNLINLTPEGITMNGKTINLTGASAVNIKGGTVNIN